ncbi:ATP-dependent helicase [Alicyclobacillus sp. SP_1]|uniref:ATP-dependent helicase n=1 Tax=Alicyclobacillus sp. SP_1 TaxID=2942475 RepID=UPI00215854D5|nr:UvrD-helicase domain-containing protein [Alicyclobacillus sp. SP_1]
MKADAREAMSPSELMRGLNREQRLAVETVDGPVLVVAGAGSGKTSVLTRRIAHLILHQGVPLHHLLAITFTNKAAKEMQQRVQQLVGKAASDLWMGTFHSVCVKILRRDGDRLGYDLNFTILDAEDQRTAISQAMLDLHYDPKKFDPAAVHFAISRWKNELRSESSLPVANASKNLAEVVARDVFPIYQRRLFAASSMDFDDLIGLTVRLLHEHEQVRDKYQDKFRYVHIDEYQDTNRAQYELVKLLSGKFQNLCAVGDSDQAIYAWRGADIENMMRFEQDYPEAKVILLENNYRSTQVILDAANALIQNNLRRKDKRLRAVRDGGEPITIASFSDGEAEATYVADSILMHVKDGGQPGDCAVLYRANAQSRVLEEALMKAGIPYTIVGGLTFYDRREIKDVFAYLRVLVNPKDEISLLRIVNTPKRGLGDGAMGKVIDFAHEQNITVLDALGRGRELGLTEKAAEAALEFQQRMLELTLWMEGMTVTEFLAEVLHSTGYREMYAQSRKSEDVQRLENIDELLNVTQSFDRRRGGTVSEFLAEVSLLSDVDKDKGKEQNSVRLMTVHASKGLEFHTVFLVGMEETLFPHVRSMDDDRGIEEERNLCYVAITRAKDKLHLTHCSERSVFGQISLREPSRFLQELPESLVQRVALTNDALYSFVPGDRVAHPQYGQGVVLEVHAGEEGKEVELTVMCHPSVGLKTYPKRYARPAN